MSDVTDQQLLRDFVECRSETAFAELVERHIDLVYSAALRMVRDSHLAQDVTQAVFLALAQNAKQLTERPVLSGWLHRAAQNIASKVVRTEVRRRAREQEAVAMNELLAHEPDAAWENIAPHLDAALGELSEPDRDALLLRYFERKSAREMAQMLGTSEEAAQKRVNRAVERLRELFAKRNVTIGASGLVVLISTNSVQAAPTALTASISAAAIAKAAAASGTTLSVFKGAIKIMAWTKMKTTLVVGVGVLLAVGTATIAVKEIAAHHSESWQEKYDLSVLDKLPPQVKILPSLPSTLQSQLHVMGGRDGKALALGQSIPDLLKAAYGVQSAQLILNAPIPEGKYDFLATFPSMEANIKAGREEIKKKFGLVGRRETIETNVLVLTVESRDAVGLKRAAGQFSGDQEPDSYSAHGQGIFPLVDYLQRALGVVIIDKTKLTDQFDIDFKWDKTPEGLKRVLLDELGLKLSPEKQAVEFVSIEKAK